MALPSSLLKLSILMNVRIIDQNVAFILLQEPLQDSIFNPPPMASNKRGIHSRRNRDSKNIANGWQNRTTHNGSSERQSRSVQQKPFFSFLHCPLFSAAPDTEKKKLFSRKNKYTSEGSFIQCPRGLKKYCHVITG